MANKTDSMTKNELYDTLAALGEIKGMTHFTVYRKEDVDTGLMIDKHKRHDSLGRELIDGFNFSLAGDQLVLRYHAQVDLKQVNEYDKLEYFYDDIESTMKDNVEFIKSQFHKISGKTLSMKQIGETHIELVPFNRIRSWVTGYMRFKVKNLSDVQQIQPEEDDEVDKRFDEKKWFDNFR